MKTNKTILAAVVFFLGVTTVNAQEGRVGINTTTPTKILDINGDLRVRDLPVIIGGTNLVADTNGIIGVYKPIDPNDFVLYNTSTNVRQNSNSNVPLTSILNVPDTNAQDSGGTTIQPTNCWAVPNSEIRFKFPTSSIRRGTAYWGMWFEMSYNGGLFSIAPTSSGMDKIKVPLFFHSRAYAKLYKKTSSNPDVWSVVDVVTVVMQTSQISPYFYEAANYDTSGNPYAVTSNSNQNFRYFLSAYYSIGDGTNINVDPDSEYKVELLYGIENFSSRQPITSSSFLQNWGVQSSAFSYFKK